MAVHIDDGIDAIDVNKKNYGIIKRIKVNT